MFSRPPDLYKRTTRAFCHSSGTGPVLNDKFTRNATVGAITTVLSFKKRAGFPSNPVSFFTQFQVSKLFKAKLFRNRLQDKTFASEFLRKRFKDWKSLLIFTFGLPRVKNSVVSIGK